MKKSLVALAALAATGAFAQSSVTISGQVDVGVVNPVGAQKTRIDQAANGANSLIFAGTEDLGGGLKANFKLVQRFSPESGLMDGTAGNRPMLQGESTVGLSGAFGSVRLGRALTAVQAWLPLSDPWGTYQAASLAGGVGPASYQTAAGSGAAGNPAGDNVVGSGSGLARIDGIFYNSPSFGGVTVDVTYAPKSTQLTGSTVAAANNFTSVSVSYSAGPLLLRAGVENNRADDKLTAYQAAYNFGVAKLQAGYTVVDLAATSVDRKGYTVGVIVPMGAVTLKGGFTRSKLDGSAADLKKTGIGLDYALSKRTTLYTSYGRDAALATDKAGFDFGVRHAF